MSQPEQPTSDRHARIAEAAVFAGIGALMIATVIEQGPPLWVAALMTVGVLGLVIGRSRPLVGSMIAMAGALAGTFNGLGDNPATLLLASAAIYVAAVNGTRRTAVTSAVVIAVAFVGSSAWASGSMVGVSVESLALTALGLASAEAVRHRRAAFEATLARAIAAETARAELVRSRVQQQRLAIARELHDIVGHSLSLINVQATAAELVIDEDPELVATAISTVRRQSHTALKELRAMLGVLRIDIEANGDAEPFSPLPQLADIERLIDNFQQDSGVEVNYRHEGEARPLTASHQLTIFRIIQEALTNILRHSKATKAAVSITYQETNVLVAVTDNGDGTATPVLKSVGQGIAGMHERITAHDGELETGPLEQGGYQVRARLPLAPV